jgi:predicted PurR-regulated permease PerM
MPSIVGSSTTATAAATGRLAPALERSAAEWALLRARLHTITPRALARGAVTTAVVLLGVWSAVATWPALFPFAFGGIIAYATFPLVNRLDRFMPRLLAAAIATGVAVALIVGVIAVIVPPLVSQVVNLLTNLPASSDLERIRGQVADYLATLPPTTRDLAQGVIDRVSGQLGGVLSGLLDTIANLLVSTVLHLFDTVGAVLGILLLPIWMLYAVRDGKGISRVVEAQFSPGIAPDAMALLRIVHRAASTFLRVQLAAAFLVGIGVWAGIAILREYNPGTMKGGELAVAAFAGVVQVIPQFGWLLGLAPAALIVLVRPDAPWLAAAYLVIYLVAVRLVGMLVGQRLGRDLNVRAAIAVPGVVVISSFGLLPLLLSAPIMVIIRDVIAYVRGRLAEPPLPAGLLPGEVRRRNAAAGRARAGVPTPVPPLYAPAPPTPGVGRATPRPATVAPAAAPIAIAGLAGPVVPGGRPSLSTISVRGEAR